MHIDHRPAYVGVVGPAEAASRDLENAASVGRLVAEAGWHVVCGGLGGVMEAVCRGARSAGGETIGFLPGHSRDEGNSYLTVSLPTGMGELRNGLVVRASDAVVAIGGSWGTLSEVSLALRTSKPVIGLNTWHVETGGAEVESPLAADSPDHVIDLLRQSLRSMFRYRARNQADVAGSGPVDDPGDRPMPSPGAEPESGRRDRTT